MDPVSIVMVGSWLELGGVLEGGGPCHLRVLVKSDGVLEVHLVKQDEGAETWSGLRWERNVGYSLNRALHEGVGVFHGSTRSQIIDALDEGLEVSADSGAVERLSANLESLDKSFVQLSDRFGSVTRENDDALRKLLAALERARQAERRVEMLKSALARTVEALAG